MGNSLTCCSCRRPQRNNDVVVVAADATNKPSLHSEASAIASSNHTEAKPMPSGQQRVATTSEGESQPGEDPSPQSHVAQTQKSTSASTSAFRNWLQTANNGKKTTTEQQMQHAIDLYNQAHSNVSGSNTFQNPVTTSTKMLQDLDRLEIQNASSLVTWKGIQVGWLLDHFFQANFVRLLQHGGYQLWFLRKVGVIEIVHRNNQEKEENLVGPFVNHIYSVAKGWGLPTEHNGQPVVADASVFLSYTGAYTIDYLVQVLKQVDPKEFVWFDVFCVDQFAWTGKGRSAEMHQFRETFMEDLESQIKAINKTALILQNWNNAMQTLEQMWVLWEIFNAAQANVNLQVLLPQSQIDHFIRKCLESNDEFDTIVGALASIDASKAHADNDADREAIFKRMEASGWFNVNSLVTSVLRKWLADQGKLHLAQERARKEGPSWILLTQLARLLQKQGNLEEAEPLFLEALEISEQVHGKHNKTTLSSMNNLANLLKDQGKLAEAEPLFKASLKGYQELWGDAHVDTLMTMNNLAVLLHDQGKLSEAESLYRTALEGRQQLLGGTNLDTLMTTNNFASLLQAQGKLTEAEPLYRMALKERQNQLGDSHEDTLLSMNNLGYLLQEQGNLPETEVLYKNALEGRMKLLGDSHPDTLASLNSLATLYYHQGKLGEAEHLFQAALKGHQRLLGESHPNTLSTTNNLARLLQDQGKKADAEPLLKAVLAGRQEVLGKLHPDTIASKLSLVSLLIELGADGQGRITNPARIQESRQLLEQLVRDCESELGSSNAHTIEAKSWYADYFGGVVPS